VCVSTVRTDLGPIVEVSWKADGCGGGNSGTPLTKPLVAGAAPGCAPAVIKSVLGLGPHRVELRQGPRAAAWHARADCPWVLQAANGAPWLKAQDSAVQVPHMQLGQPAWCMPLSLVQASRKENYGYIRCDCRAHLRQRALPALHTQSLQDFKGEAKPACPCPAPGVIQIAAGNCAFPLQVAAR